MATPSLNIWHIISLLGAFLGIFLAFVILLHKKGNRAANLFLALFVIVFSLRLFEIVAFWSRYLVDFPYLISTTHPFLFLFGPFLFFYTLFLINERKKIFPRDIIHLLPFLLNVLIYIPFYFLDPGIKAEIVIRAFTGGENNAPSAIILIYIMQVPHLFLYMYAIIARLKDYNSEIVNKFSAIEIINLKWLQQLVVLFGIFTTC